VSTQTPVPVPSGIFVGPGSGGGGGGGLLGQAQYAPAVTAVKGVSSASLVAIDPTNLTVSFTTAKSGPGSTSVVCRASFVADTGSNMILGFTDHTSLAARGEQSVLSTGSIGAVPVEIAILVTGLTANTAYQFDLAAAGPTSGAINVLIAGVGELNNKGGVVTLEVLAGDN
jgi:hypothetical protein